VRVAGERVQDKNGVVPPRIQRSQEVRFDGADGQPLWQHRPRELKPANDTYLLRPEKR